MSALTNNQAAVLAFIQSHIQALDRPPTRREIADRFRWSSANAAEQVVKALERKGMLRTTPGKARAIQLI